MSIGFDDGANEFHTTTAHAPHEKALAELLRILSALLEENPAQNEYVLPWNRNPEEFDFRFFKDGENVLLEIYQYPTDERETKEPREGFRAHGKGQRSLPKPLPKLSTSFTPTAIRTNLNLTGDSLFRSKNMNDLRPSTEIGAKLDSFKDLKQEFLMKEKLLDL